MRPTSEVSNPSFQHQDREGALPRSSLILAPRTTRYSHGPSRPSAYLNQPSHLLRAQLPFTVCPDHLGCFHQSIFGHNKDGLPISILGGFAP